MKPNHFLMMGVCGSGKSTIGSMLADAIGATFLDADDFHPIANREKMQQGTPLTDSDRAPWLASLSEKMQSLKNTSFVLACSALKETYRKTLQLGCPDLKIIFLHGDPALLAARMSARDNHFMPSSMLASQLSTLEAPSDAFSLNISSPPADLLSQLLQHFSPTLHHV
jgi:gluconokinase